MALEALPFASSSISPTSATSKAERELFEDAQNNGPTSSTPIASGSGEFYGFALFILATLVLVGWCVWALTPDRILKRVGIDYYPNRCVIVRGMLD